MHIATTTLVACLAFSVGPWLGVLATVCTLVMAVASVSLGWHYALDGYVGAALAIAVWWIAGRIEREAPEAAPETARATVIKLQPVGVWVPPSQRRAAATLPDRATAVASAGDAPPRAGSNVQRPRPVRTL